MSFSQALSGLNAASDSLGVIGHNIANAETYGFKSSQIQFADVYAGSKIGQGVRVAGVLQNFGTGTISNTGRSLDLAINGDGFFRLKQNDQTVYSRNGQFVMTKDGYLENSSGARLTGYPAVGGVPSTGGQPEVLQVPTSGMEANATTKMDMVLNLKANDTVPTGGSFDPDQHNTYNYSSTGTIYDSLGVSHTLTTYYIKDNSPAVNTWKTRVQIDGNPPTTVTPPTPGVGKLVFDNNGKLDQTNSTFPSYTYDPKTTDPTSGASDIAFDLNFDGTTQFGSDYEMTSLTQDGYTSGSLVGINFDKSGNLVANYSNEVSRTVGTLSLADFRSKENLERIGDNAWVETGDSGQPMLGTAGTGMIGSLQGSALEESNVDLAKQLVNLITAQRDYQANAQTIKTQNNIMQTVVNLR